MGLSLWRQRGNGGVKSNSSLALSFWSLHMTDKQVPGRWLRRLMQISYQLLLLSLGENFGCFFAMLDTCELLRLSNVPITVVMLLTVSIEIFYCVFFPNKSQVLLTASWCFYLGFMWTIMQFLWVFSSPVPIAQMNFFLKSEFACCMLLSLSSLLLNTFHLLQNQKGNFNRSLHRVFLG